MIKNIDEFESKEIKNFKGGLGSVIMNKVEEVPSIVRNYARITINPHSSIGRHSHIDDSELVYCLSGTGKVFDGTEYKEMTSGDINVLIHGEHEIINDTNEELVILIVVITNQN